MYLKLLKIQDKQQLEQDGLSPKRSHMMDKNVESRQD